MLDTAKEVINLPDTICNEFQHNVQQYLIRHQSILDILSKLGETTARVNRAVTKSVTQCGCIEIKGKKNSLPENVSINELKSFFSSQVEGNLCEQCREIIEQEMGKHLYYLTALCTTFDLNLLDIIQQENKKISTLRIFNLT